jgi:hypothetical protein
MNKKIVVFLTTLIIVVIAVAFFLINKTTSGPMVYVDPSMIERGVGQDFTVNINASDIDNLVGWQFQLGWNLTILTLINVTEGAFLKSGGDTFFGYELNETLGYVLAYSSLLRNVTGVNGTGVLASIELHVKNQGSCNLDLHNTELVDASEQLITHTTNGGHFSTGS